MNAIVADRDLWLRGGTLVEEPGDDPEVKNLVQQGQLVSFRAQLLYGLEVVGGRIEQTGEYNPSYLPQEGDDGDVPNAFLNGSPRG